MVTYAFSLYDVKAGVFATPFFFPADAMARRACKDLASDLNTLVGRHPADFVLYRVGCFDDHRGVFESEKPEHLGVCEQFLDTPKVQGMFEFPAKEAV